MSTVELNIDPTSSFDIQVHPSVLPIGTKVGDLIQINPILTNNNKKGKSKALLYKVERIDEEQDNTSGIGASKNISSASRRSKAQVIVNQQVASSFSWIKNRIEVVITLVSSPTPSTITASHVELYFSAVYLSRSDMLRLTLSLANTALYLNQRVTLPGSTARLRVGGIYNLNRKQVKSAWVEDETKIIFRSESARTYVFIEISEEMNHFEEDGSLLREKCELFLTELLKRLESTSHTLSIILYGRVIYEDNGEGDEERAPIRKSEDGVLYRDFFKVILDLSPTPPASLVRTVSTEIRRWNEEVLLRKTTTGLQKLSGRIAYAHESPVLEAVNLALNSFEEHWVDRDLQRTGLGLIVLTAGTSYYQVVKSLLRLTTERMLYHGIGLDLISLSKTPLHSVPLFSFRSHEPGLADEGLPSIPSTSNSSSSVRDPRKEPINSRLSALPDDQRDPLYYDSPRPSLETSIYYSEPMFVFCSFFSSQIDKPHRIDRFMPRARCYELFSQGIGDRIPISIPLLPSASEYAREEGGSEAGGGGGMNFLSEKEKRNLRRDKYDAEAVGSRYSNELNGSWVNRQSGTTNTTSGASESEDDVRAAEELRGRKVIATRRDKRGMIISDNKRDGLMIKEDEEERSKTPMGRIVTSPSLPSTRSTSKPASIRTVSSNFPKSNSAKSSATPALISRLTSTTTASKPASTTTGGGGGGGWLGMFKSGLSVASTSIATITKLDAQANVKPDLEIISGSVRSYSSRATSPSASLRVIIPPTATMPSQPISISTRAAQTKEADQPVNSLSLKKFPQLGGLSGGSIGGRNSVGGGFKSFDSKFNPSKPGKRSLGLADQARRWASIFIRHSNDQRAVNWISITRGACLPITTDYLPSAEALSTQYQVNKYSIETSFATSSFLLRTDNARRSPALELVTELISQRLSHGFQICTPANALGALDEINLATDKTVPQVLKDIQDGELSAIYLSLSNQIHRISYDRATSSVIVKISRRRRTWSKVDYKYSGLIWTLGSTNWDYCKSLNFPYPDMIDPIDWENLDKLVAGVSKPLANSMGPNSRYWRTRLILLPADIIPDREFISSKLKGGEKKLTDEAIQLQGFSHFMDLIQVARWSPPGVEKAATPTEITTLSPPEWALKMAREALIANSATTPSELTPTVRTSRWLRKVTPSTRLEAGSNDRDRSISPLGRREASSSRTRASTTSTTITSAVTTMKPPVIQMTYSVILDLDLQQKSGRAERVLCHFDRSHNPNAAYHVELTWLAGSGKIIDSNIQSWTRALGRFGLNLIEVGTREVGNRHNPFQSAIKVCLCVDPPELTEGQAVNHYEIEVLKKLGFFLDAGAEHTFSSEVEVEYSYRPTGTSQSQYIHRSGTLLVSIISNRDESVATSSIEGDVEIKRDDKKEFGFYCQPNRIFLSHSKGNCDEILSRLKNLSSDEIMLRSLWEL